MAYPPLIPEMMIELKLSYSQAGMLMSGFFIGYLVMQLPIGIISDKFGTKKVFTLSLLMTGIICILTGFAFSFFDCLVYRFINGLAAGCIYAPASALIIRWFPPKDRAISIGFFTIANTVGTFFAMLFSAYISTLFGSWRWSFWILGIPIILMAVPSFLLVREYPKRSLKFDGIAKIENISSYFSIVLKDFRVLSLCLAALAGSSIFIGSLTWIPTYLVTNLGLSDTSAGSITSFIVIFATISTPLGGFVADRIIKKRSPIIYFPVVLAGIFCIIFSYLGPQGLYSTIAFFTCIIFFSIMWCIAPSLLSDWLPISVMGTATGFLNFIAIFGAILGPYSYGYVLDFSGSHSMGWSILGLTAIILASPMFFVMCKDFGLKF
jgi:MFS family permease